MQLRKKSGLFMSDHRRFSLSETWEEYLSLIDGILPHKAKKVIENKKLFYSIVIIAVFQLLIYSIVAVYWLLS